MAWACAAAPRLISRARSSSEINEAASPPELVAHQNSNSAGASDAGRDVDLFEDYYDPTIDPIALSKAFADARTEHLAVSSHTALLRRRFERPRNERCWRGQR